MGTRALVSALGTCCLLLAGLALSACEGDKPKTDTQATASATAAAPKPGEDPRLASAVESAARLQDGGAGDGPPPSGVFGPGEADRAHPPTAGRKIDLMDPGSEPRVSLRAGAGAAWPKSFQITVAQRVGPQAMPTLEYTVAVKTGGEDAKAPADAAKADVAKADAGAVSFVIKKVKLAKMQPGAVPSDLEKEIAKLESSRVDAMVGPDGALSELKTTMAKSGDAGLAPVLGAFADSLEQSFVPVPDSAVGTGAYWMVVDRVKPVGLDLVRYRVFRVKELKGSTAELNVDLRQYSVGGKVDLGGGQDELTAAACESAGQGSAMVQVGQRVPVLYELGVPLRMQLASAQRPGQAMLLQAEFAARLSAGAPEGATKPSPSEP